MRLQSQCILSEYHITEMQQTRWRRWDISSFLYFPKHSVLHMTSDILRMWGTLQGHRLFTLWMSDDSHFNYNMKKYTKNNHVSKQIRTEILKLQEPSYLNKKKS